RENRCSGCGKLAVTVVPPRLVISKANCKAGTELAISNANSTPPLVRSRTSLMVSGPTLTVLVAPSREANSSFWGFVSTATISAAPTRLAAKRALRPTPPRPTTATEQPADTFAVLITAPTPVRTATPNTAASRAGKEASTLIAERRDTTAYSAYPDTPI